MTPRLTFNPRVRLDEHARDLYRQQPWVPVVPRNGMYVRCWAGHGQRFASLVRRTWAALPYRARRRLLKYWRAGGPVNSICPELELTSWWSQQNGRTFAACFQEGHVLRFWAPLIDLLPGFLVEGVVAHELAHAYLAAVGETYERTPAEWDAYHQDGLAYFWDGEEADVVNVMDSWGFDEDARDRWVADHRSECDRIAQEWESGL